MKELKIQISDEIYDELIRISNELKTQDNRATASPYYYTIRESKTIPTSQDYSDKYIWYADYDGDEIDYDLSNINEFKKYLDGYLGDDINEYNRLVDLYNNAYDYEDFLENELNIRKVYIIENEFFSNVFLTESAAEQYIKNDKHNLMGNNNYTYIEYAKKNRELETIINFLKSLTN